MRKLTEDKISATLLVSMVINISFRLMDCSGGSLGFPSISALRDDFCKRKQPGTDIQIGLLRCSDVDLKANLVVLQSEIDDPTTRGKPRRFPNSQNGQPLDHVDDIRDVFFFRR